MSSKARKETKTSHGENLLKMDFIEREVESTCQKKDSQMAIKLLQVHNEIWPAIAYHEFR